MADDGLGRYMPPELAEGFTPLALLKDGPDRQTLLVQEKGGERRFILKRMLAAPEDAERKYRALSGIEGGVPRMYRLLCRDGYAYVLREYVPGQTLLDWVQKRGALPAKEAAGVGLAVCRTLEKLHGCQPPLIHRDIKAENIIRTPAGEYVLIDFGIARFYDEGEDRDTQQQGTAFSAPPEQYGYRQTDPRADIYALGVLLHELSTGECMLDRGTEPAALRPVIRRCTRFDPEDRYRSAGEAERALRPAAAGHRPRVRAAVAAAAACALLALGAAARFAFRPAPASELYTFQSPAIEWETCRRLGKEPGTVTRDDLTRVTRLFLCGSESFDAWEQIDIHGEEIRIGSAPGGTGGTVDTLEDLRYFTALQELALCNQQITDLTPLAGSGVQRLALHGNRITDLAPLAECGQLLDLFISANPVTDLTPLTRCPRLTDLNVGATALTDLGPAAAIPELQFFSMHDCPGVTDLSPLASMERLVCLSVRPVTAEDLARIGAMEQLRQLYVWCGEPAEDMTALSGLRGLERLFADMPAASLRGLEGMAELRYLDVRSGRPLDPEPLLGLTHLEALNAASLAEGTLWKLAGLPALRNVSCVAAQADELRRALADRPEVEIVVY